MTLLAAMMRPSATMAKASGAGSTMGADVLVLVRHAEQTAAAGAASTSATNTSTCSEVPPGLAW